MTTIAKLLKHDFTKGDLNLFDTNGNETYYETYGYWLKKEYDYNGKVIYYEKSYGYWIKREYDSDGNETYFEDSNGYWCKWEFDSNGKETYFEGSNGYWYKKEFDSNGNEIYYEDSAGDIEDNRPKANCGKTVTIDGIEYELKAKK